MGGSIGHQTVSQQPALIRRTTATAGATIRRGSKGCGRGTAQACLATGRETIVGTRTPFITLRGETLLRRAGMSSSYGPLTSLPKPRQRSAVQVTAPERRPPQVHYVVDNYFRNLGCGAATVNAAGSARAVAVEGGGGGGPASAGAALTTVRRWALVGRPRAARRMKSRDAVQKLEVRTRESRSTEETRHARGPVMTTSPRPPSPCGHDRSAGGEAVLTVTEPVHHVQRRNRHRCGDTPKPSCRRCRSGGQPDGGCAGG